MKYPESAHAYAWLIGLKGLEVGGSAHNAFNLDTLNVDYTNEVTEYKQAEIELCGEMMPVDIVAWAWDIPVPDKSYDFVLASHVIEHIWDPIETLKEWARIARKFIYLVVPQRDALPSDVAKPLTTLEEIIKRHQDPDKKHLELGHVSRWNSKTFCEMVTHFGFVVSSCEDPDGKVGNGFAVVINVEKSDL
jgi:SAM-dependent methyltransferase